jgi:tetratricopeptide (TPR) repeat protein
MAQDYKAAVVDQTRMEVRADSSASCAPSAEPFEAAIAEAISLRAAASADSNVQSLRDAASRLARAIPEACANAASWLPVLERERGMLLRLAATREADLTGLAGSVAILEQAMPKQKGVEAAATENELGLAKRLLGQAQKDTALLGDAIEHYRRALAAFDSAGDDTNATTVRWNLGIALRILGQGTNDRKHLNEAAALFRQVLAALDRQQAPRDWSVAQANLGQTLLALGENGNDLDALSQAAAALGLALENAQSDGRTLREWAETQNALANALEILGEREWSIERLQAALKARRNARVLYESAGLDSYRFYFETRIAALERLIELRKAEPIIASAEREAGTEAPAGAPP